jgi:hypothetical protein
MPTPTAKPSMPGQPRILRNCNEEGKGAKMCQVFRKPSESVQKESETCCDVNEPDLRGKDYFS